MKGEQIPLKKFISCSSLLCVGSYLLAVFALLALAGDIGCGSGPSVVGGISGMFGGQLKIGLLAAVLFPAVLLLAVRKLTRSPKKGSSVC